MTPRLERVDPSDITLISRLLRDADLTVSGLSAPSVHLWTAWVGDVPVGSTGYELNGARTDALIRSVSVVHEHRGTGLGSWLASEALTFARADGAGRAWLFSRRSGPFWQKLGFCRADRDEMSAVLDDTHQVRLFRESGQLAGETAWSRLLV